jgi:hypothetical protein
LITTIREESGPDERRFLIQGRPLVQGLSWLTWGPVAALLVITLLTGCAIIFDIREQSLLAKALFIMAFLGLPVLAWAATSLITHRLAESYLEQERAEATQERLIGLRPRQGELFYRFGAGAAEERLPYQEIREVRVAPPLGDRDGRKACLILEIEGGRVILLDETLGTQTQKADLAKEIESSLKNFQNKK